MTARNQRFWTRCGSRPESAILDGVGSRPESVILDATWFAPGIGDSFAPRIFDFRRVGRARNRRELVRRIDDFGRDVVRALGRELDQARNLRLSTRLHSGKLLRNTPERFLQGSIQKNLPK